MPSGISTIALFAPAVATNAVFSVRRASKGVDSMQDNPFYGIMNMDIAAGQTIKGLTAMGALAGTEFEGAKQWIKNTSQSSKAFSNVAKVLNFTSNNINPIICATSGIKVLGSDDKIDTAARESLALGTMFLFEGTAKKVLGMPKMVKNPETGKKEAQHVEGLYKKLFKEKQIEAIKEYCSTKKALKYLPGTAKGLGFVAASIGGYKLGNLMAEYALGKEKEKRA